MGDKHAPTKLFSPVHLDLQCVLFFKTRPPIDPVDFVHRICEEIVSNSSVRKMKYANRLTPMTMIGKATEKGVEEVGKEVLGATFNLAKVGHEEKDQNEKAHQHCSVSRTPMKLLSYTLSLPFIARRL
jgi:tRNA acetyltransferase TAN1